MQCSHKLTQGLQHHQQAVNGIHISTNITNNYSNTNNSMMTKTTNNNSVTLLIQSSNIKNDNCYIYGSKGWSIIIDINLNSIANNNTNSDPNNNTNNFGIELVQVNDKVNVSNDTSTYDSTQCERMKSNNDNAMLTQIVLLKQKVAAMVKLNESVNVSYM